MIISKNEIVRFTIIGSRMLVNSVVLARQPNATEIVDILMAWKNVIQWMATTKPTSSILSRAPLDSLIDC